MSHIIGERISMELSKQGKTQRWLAEQVGCTECSMTRYIDGKRIPKATTLREIAKALKVDANYLLGIEVKMTNADRIRAMSNEELAEFIVTDFNALGCNGCDEPVNEYGSCTGDCKKLYLKWLQSEVE